MHIKQTNSGVFNNFFMSILLALAWLGCTAASAATSVSVVATPSSAVAPANVTLSVAVTADPGPVTVANVEYVNGNSKLGVVTTAPFSLDLTNLEPGSYVIKAYVRLADAQNTLLTSAPVPLTVSGGTAGSAAVYYIHTDQLNTPRVIADQNQSVVWKWESDGFGVAPPNEQPGAAAAFEFNPRFAGQYFDRESNLHYNYFRDYDPQTGRYIQSDPIGLSDGVNTYLYVKGNPIVGADPLGLATVYYWAYRDNQNVGHVSMTLDDGTHISWWPRSGEKTGDSPAVAMPDLKGDVASEGSPDLSIYVSGLDEVAIRKWWENFRRKHRTWNFTGQNCAATVAEGMGAGGAMGMAWLGGYFPGNLVWTPSNVKDYANAVVAGVDGRRSAGLPGTGK